MVESQSFGDGGMALGKDVRTGALVGHDPFDSRRMNPHMVVMGSVGADKAAFGRIRVVRESGCGVRVYVLDSSGDYAGVVRALGGEVCMVGSDGWGLNPFLLEYRRDVGDAVVRISSLCSMVGAILEGRAGRRAKGRTGWNMMAVIDACLLGFYEGEIADKRTGLLGKSGISGFCEFLDSEKGRRLGGGELVGGLRGFLEDCPWLLTGGSGGDLLEDERRLVSLDLSNIGEDVKSAATAVCLESVWGMTVREAGPPRRLVVGDVGVLEGSAFGIDLLISIIKRARKFRFGVMVVTDDVDGFLSARDGLSDWAFHPGRSMLQNSATKVVLSCQDERVLDLLGDALALEPEWGEFLRNAGREQGVVMNECGEACGVDIVLTESERGLGLSL